jgi:outer membrane protein insertion porin family
MPDHLRPIQRRCQRLACLFATVALLVPFSATGCKAWRSPAEENIFDVRFQSPDPAPSTATPSTGQSQASPNQEKLIAEIRVIGNERLATHQVLRNVNSRVGRYFDPDILKKDVEQLWRMPEIKRVNGPFLERTPQGYIITIEIEEKPFLDSIEFVGNRGISDRALKRHLSISDGQRLDVYEIRMMKGRIEEHYRDKGYPNTQVEIIDGSESGDRKVTFLIHEDQKQRYWATQFEGNTVVSDGRLKTQVKSRPGIGKLFGGLVKREEIDQDVKRLMTYYHNLGYFSCRIGREIAESNDGRWLTLKFIVDEGPRYQVRNVAFIGNEVYGYEDLSGLVKLKPEDGELPYFDASLMNADLVKLRDLYGSTGYVFADVEAEPRFLETPGTIDLVYKIAEGKQYRVGKIFVEIGGDYGVTKREVLLNRLSLRPGDIIDIREIRNSERRLMSSQIFAGSDPSVPGPPPRIVVRPPELRELERMARDDWGMTR